jgi:hypothetical protein
MDGSLKEQCHEIFDFWFFFMNPFPQAPEYTKRQSQIFSKVAEIFTAQGAPPVSLMPVANGKKFSN